MKIAKIFFNAFILEERERKVLINYIRAKTKQKKLNNCKEN
jgi:hypothetical protein